MHQINVSAEFLHGLAGKQFVAIRFEVIPPREDKGSAASHLFSAFVVDARGVWFVVTAGHVINEIKDAKAKGFSIANVYLQDRSAGHNYKLGVPIPFELSEWSVFEGDPDGTDYAAWPLPPLIVRNLQQGGIQAIGEHAWGNPDASSGATFMMVGAPREGVIHGPGSSKQYKLLVIPLDLCEPPANAKNKEQRVFAKIRPPTDGSKGVADVAGMSGGPIYEVVVRDDSLTSWAVGVQSSWFPESRIVSFCPAGEFLDALVKAVERLGQQDLPVGAEPSI
jgi:hypothetical protein